MKVLDLHCDTISRLHRSEGCQRGDSLRKNAIHVDLEKMARGDYLLQNFALFVCMEEVENPFESAMEMTDRYYEELKKNQDLIAPAFRFQDIVDHQAEGRMSSLLTLEEGGILKGKIEFLRIFYRLGVRMITLTWNYENGIGAPNIVFDENKIPQFSRRNEKGLTGFGIDLVQAMEGLGMIVDVSHLSDGGFWDVVKYTEKPFVASHSNAAAVCNVCRNLTDDMIRALADRGGVMGLNFCGSFLVPGAEKNPMENRIGSIAHMVCHLKHIRNVGGIEVCALGTDFDGIPGNPQIENASMMPRLAEALEQEGFTAGEIEKIFYKNALRVYQELL